MNMSRLLGAFSATLVSLVLATSAHATLIGVLPATLNGTDYQAYYDTTTDLSWLANTNAAVGSAYDTYSPGSGLMNWTDANAWAAGLDINGVTGWRLPNVGPVHGTVYNYNYAFDGSTDFGYNISAPGTVYVGSKGSDMSYLYYDVLGNNGYCDTSGNCPQTGWSFNTGPFSNLQADFYWSATEYAPVTGFAWDFGFNVGAQSYGAENTFLYAWAVHSGNVGAAVVPLPGAVWLFGSGLLGILGVGRQRRC